MTPRKIDARHFGCPPLTAPDPPASPPPPSYAQGAAWGLFAISIWVGWILLTRHGVTTTLSPYDLVALRFAFAGLVLLPVVARRGLGIRRVGTRRWMLIVCCAGVPYVLVASSGLLFAPAAHAGALIPGTMPLWAALLAVWILQERIEPTRRAGLFLIPVGIVLILGNGLVDLSAGHWRGHLLFLLAAMTWATFTVAMRSAAQAGFDALHAAAVVSVVSAVVYLPVYALWLPHGLATAPASAIVVQTLYQGLMVSIVSLFAYARAVSILGASLGASFASLVPVLAMLTAIPLLGEWPSVMDTLGIAAITLGVFLSSGAFHALRQRGRDA
ncbi:MAG: DMT family transporter [Betaproteobacteria bacterium]|nr:DMT family transporter [Betaproteobacteria bacterium]